MPKKICNQIGCNSLISMKERYCEDHKRDVVKASNKDYDLKRRNKRFNKFYHCAAWKEKREVIMKKHGGLCIACQRRDMVTNADVVDHIIPLEEDWNKRLDLKNLQPLCHSCHAKKTANDERTYREGGKNSYNPDRATPKPLSTFDKNHFQGGGGCH